MRVKALVIPSPSGRSPRIVANTTYQMAARKAIQERNMENWGALRGGRSLFRNLIAAIVLMVPFEAARAADIAWPSEVNAVYRFSFNGFNVGTYKFAVHYDGKTYAATGKAEISALFGAFKWVGNLTGAGAFEGPGPKPASYEMSYKTKSKVTTVKLGFAESKVASIALAPKKAPSPETVKLKPENLQNVFDPMGATLAVSDADPSNACNRTIPVFDGWTRYDLQLSLKGREHISEKKPSGQPRELLVCRVKYVPIAGHKPKDFIDPWIDYNHIEVALRAVPTAGVYVPYRITVPSTIGPGVLTLDTINIKAANNQQIALKQ
jgi:Protein of unknown function (DUF3108)